MPDDRNYDYEIDKALNSAPGGFEVSDESGWNESGDVYTAEVTLEAEDDIEAIVDHLRKELPDADVWASAPGESGNEYTITIDVSEEDD